MSGLPEEPIAALCPYCGRKNPDLLTACSGCGTPLTSEKPQENTEPRKKSKTLAVLLALALGPLGLCYTSLSAGVLMFVVALPFILTHTGGLWVTIGGRILAAVWVYTAFREEVETEAPNAKRYSEQLLQKAAYLENSNRADAITVYEEVIKLYPNTRASKEAARNIETLRRSV